MERIHIRLPWAAARLWTAASACGLAFFAFILSAQPVRADHAAPPDFRAHFLTLCDLAAAKVSDENTLGPFFVDSYGVRALCAAYDLTGDPNYLNACRAWSRRMVRYQDEMIPRGAYYMHYGRKPGEKTGDWYAADSSSIGMAVLATAIRCHGSEQKLFLKSAEKFANLVIKNYVNSSGGVSDGLLHQSSNAWWCSSGLFGSFLFNLYANTGDKHYLNTALRLTDWLNQLDLTKDQPFPLSQQGPAMIMYVMENYSSGWPYISKDDEIKKAAADKVSWCLDWIRGQQQKLMAQRDWPPTIGWGMKFGGLPFHEYVFARYWSDDQYLAAGDAEMERLAPVVFTDNPPQMTQLPFFMLMSYAERLDPGDMYRSGLRH
ncbi:MAG TPA: hypothetical protein VGV18_04240 [Verrucomicrobiae bacterium]|nr:hypothetical protein [Verrucomicrobiae bacterium]